ncbi:MAG: glycogen-binding domain-containing protein, partial [Longimicrobiales bacterium]
ALLWSTPEPDGARRSEAAFDVVASWTLPAGLSVRASAGRAARDPLYGAPGGLTVAVGMAWERALGGPDSEPPVVELTDASGAGQRVRFTFEAPQASRVELAGDFSAWELVPMRREGERWVIDQVVGPGLHRFAFRVDGETWTVPEHAPGIADDGWGRKTASFFVEGAP